MTVGALAALSCRGRHDAPVSENPSPSAVRPCPARESLPADWPQLPQAVAVEVFDAWHGEGKAHEVFMRLERRRPGEFEIRAKVSTGAQVCERELDPSALEMALTPPCYCPIETACPCETDGFVRRTATVASLAVEAFLTEAARYGPDLENKVRSSARGGPHWTDDQPRWHVIVWTHAQAVPIHLSVFNQNRFWLANGIYLGATPGGQADAPVRFGLHQTLTETYRAMLKQIGLDNWIAELWRSAPKN